MQSARLPTIGIDCRFAATHSGMGRYTRELVTHLLRRNDPVQYVLFTRGKDNPWLPADVTTHYSLQTTNHPHYSLSEQFHFPRKIYNNKIDLFFSPHFNIPILSRVPFVITNHDLILHRYPNQASLPRRLAYRFLMGQSVHRARSIIAVSRFTKNELVNVYGTSIDAKCTVIPEGVSSVFTPQPRNDQAPYFLYVGNAKEHKNVQTLIDARAMLPETAPTLVLVTSGPEVDRLVLKQGTRRIASVDDAELPSLYSNAEAFVTASLYEGFCLPAAEALACGCPVIAPRTTAIAELGEGIRWTDPTAEAIAQAMSERRARPTPRRIGSWEDVAAKTAEIFRKCLTLG